ncbi:MAG: hypothetical protein RR477_00105 [Raoultibacter sp.]
MGSMTTVTVAEARAHFSKIGSAVNATGESVTVFRNSKPWLIIAPVEEKAPNVETRKAMMEADELLSNPERQRFSSFEDMMDELKRETHAQA